MHSQPNNNDLTSNVRNSCNLPVHAYKNMYEREQAEEHRKKEQNKDVIHVTNYLRRRGDT